MMRALHSRTDASIRTGFGSLVLAMSVLPMAAHADIRFTASVSPGIHRLSERLPIRISIENTGKKAIYVYGDLDYYIRLFAYTADGKPISPTFIQETLSPPPQKDSFSRIEPGHFLSAVWNEDLKGLGIREPGAYRLSLDYRSNFGPEFSFGLPVWEGEKSTTLPIEVSK